MELCPAIFTKNGIMPRNFYKKWNYAPQFLQKMELFFSFLQEETALQTEENNIYMYI